MTDLLTPSDADHAEVSPTATEAAPARQRAFRAATLDEAVAAARAELGPAVELIEAHRVRRGGLGGFFATDLGVEIIAVPQRTAPIGSAVSTERSIPAPMPLPQSAGVEPMPATDPVLPVAPASAEVVTALDRLIQHAESIDRAIPVEHADRVPALSTVDDIDPLWLSDDARARASDPSSFEAHLESEMAAIAVGSSDAELAMRQIIDRAPAVDRDDSTAEILRPTGTLDETSAPGIVGQTTNPDIWTDGAPGPMPIGAEVDERSTVATEDFETADMVGDATDVVNDLVGTDASEAGAVDAATSEVIEELNETSAEPIDAMDEATCDPDTTTQSAMLAPPSALLNPGLALVGEDPIDEPLDPSIEELDALLREVGITLDAAESPAAPTPIAPSSLSSIEALTRLAAEQLLDGVTAFERSSTERISRLSVSVTAPDGTTVSVASDLMEPLAGPMLEAAPFEPVEAEDGDA